MRQNMQRNTMRVRLTSGQRRIMTTCVSHPKCGTFFCFLSFSYEPSGARTQMYHSATLPLSAPLQTGFVVFLPKNTPPDVITNRKPCHTPTQCMRVTGIPVPHANRACLLTASTQFPVEGPQTLTVKILGNKNTTCCLHRKQCSK